MKNQQVGIETPEITETPADIGPAEAKSGKGQLAAGIAIGAVATAATAGALAWYYRASLLAKIAKLAAENEELKTMAGRLVAQLAELVKENEYLKSATGAGTQLRSHRVR